MSDETCVGIDVPFTSPPLIVSRGPATVVAGEFALTPA
jgi:hypothetical protein